MSLWLHLAWLQNQLGKLKARRQMAGRQCVRSRLCCCVRLLRCIEEPWGPRRFLHSLAWGSDTPALQLRTKEKALILIVVSLAEEYSPISLLALSFAQPHISLVGKFRLIRRMSDIHSGMLVHGSDAANKGYLTAPYCIGWHQVLPWLFC